MWIVCLIFPKKIKNDILEYYLLQFWQCFNLYHALGLLSGQQIYDIFKNAEIFTRSPVVQNIISLTSWLVVKMLTVPASTIPNS